jgi:hypothetical protein
MVKMSRLFDRSSAGTSGFKNANMNPFERGFTVPKMSGRSTSGLSSFFGLLLGLGSLCGAGGTFGSCAGGLPLDLWKRRAVVVKDRRNMVGAVFVVETQLSDVCVL